MKDRYRTLAVSISRRQTLVVTALCVLAGVLVTGALAALVNLAGTPPQTTTVRGAIYETIQPTDATGSGVFESFLRTQSDNKSDPALTERGFNTNAQPTYDAKSGAFTHSILLSSIPTISRGGILYRELVTDINQSSATINLNEVELWLTTNEDIDGYDQGTGTFTTGPADKRYELDAPGFNDTILMNANVGSGSGKGDYRLLVPDSLFQNVAGFPYCTYGQATGCTTRLALWTVWGEIADGSSAQDNGGFEEWGVAKYTGSKSGVKFNDANANGVRDTGEAGLPGWTIYVDLNDNGTADTGEPFAVTDATGAYLLKPIPPGTWKIHEVAQAGWTCTAPATTDAHGCYFQHTWDADDAFTGNNFGNFQKVDPVVATAIHNASHTVVTSVDVGTTVHDRASVSAPASPPGLPTPTGSVVIQWFENDGCTGSPADSSASTALSGGVVDVTAFTKTPTAAGGYAFRAVYTSDNIYFNNKTGPCEPLTVNKVDPVVATDIHNAAHSVVTSVDVGTTVHDRASVSAPASPPGLPTPDGNVTIYWFTNGTCTPDADSNSGAQALSGGVVDVTGFTKTPTTSGSYAFQAVYAGNGTYNSKTGPCEPLTVNKVSPNISTTPNPSSGTVGVTLNDSASLTGGYNPTGTITFRLYAPSDPTCSGTAAYTQAVTVSGNGSYSTTPGFVSNATGTWHWTASYSGDGANNPASSGCADEPVTLTGAQGCTPGFWKNHETMWDSPTDPVVAALLPFLVSPFGYDSGLANFNNQEFATIFGITDAQMTAAGLDPDLTLLEALNTGGGQFEALVRHGTAALLSSEWVAYPYSASYVLNGVRNAFINNNYNYNNILTELTAANNLSEAACLTGS